MKLGIIGAGSWATALAQILSKNFQSVILWARDKDVAENINQTHKNDKYLPEISLNPNISATTDLEEIFLQDIIIIAIPMQHIRETISNIKLKKEKMIISASKGIEIGTLKLPSDVIKESLDIPEENIFALSGPSFAKEVAKELPTALTLAGKDIQKAEKLQQLLNTKTFRIYISEDIKGVEIGGAVKNVIAIACGASDGLKLGNNARASLITRGLYEMTKFVPIFNANPQTIYGLSGLGDLVLTATGDLSRNRRFGLLIGEGYSVEEAIKIINQTIEGIETVKAIKQLSEKYNLELPISEMVYKVIYEKLNIKKAVDLLMNREPKKEFL